MKLTDVQADALQELGNIGAAHAATTLSTMLSANVTMSVPEIKMIDISEIYKYVGDEVAALVLFQINGEVKHGGYLLLYIAKLNRLSPMPVKETENGDVLIQGQVYVSMAGFHSVISGMITDSGQKGGKIVHSKAPPEHSVRPAVDKTFSSAAHVFGSHAVSTILSGMGNDGGEGTLAVKQQGGVTLVCRESDCLVYGMARSALSRNCVDSVIPLRTMAEEITRTVKNMGG